MAELRQIVLVKTPRIPAAIGGKGDKSLLFFAGVTSTMNATFRDREFAPRGSKLDDSSWLELIATQTQRHVIPCPKILLRKSPVAASVLDRTSTIGYSRAPSGGPVRGLSGVVWQGPNRAAIKAKGLAMLCIIVAAFMLKGRLGSCHSPAG